MQLVSLATRIRQEHEAVATSIMKAVEHAITAGELLLEAKGQVKHGEWLSWLADNCEISARTAQAYMRLARAPLEKRNAVADLPLREALSAMASPRRYYWDCCGDEFMPPCDCGVDFLLHDADGRVIGRITRQGDEYLRIVGDEVVATAHWRPPQ
jgi:Protein of unknown function (DUF3102)